MLKVVYGSVLRKIQNNRETETNETKKKIIEREHISHKIMRYNEIGEAKVMCASERMSEEKREREREKESLQKSS